MPGGRSKDARATKQSMRGWEAIRTIRGAVRGVEAGWGRRIGEARVEQLRTILRDLVAALER